MSYKVTDHIWKMELRLPEKVVLLRMADYAGDDGGNIFPSVARVAKDCGLSDRAVQLILRKYVDEGLLVIVDEGGGRSKTRHYAMDLERAKEMAGPAGEPKRAKRANKAFAHSNGHDAAETVKRANESAEKGEEQIHPTLQDSPIEEDSHANACGAVAPVGGTVVAFPLDDKAKLLGPVLASLTARLPSTDPDKIRSLLFRAYHKLDPQTALDLGAMAAIKDEPWSWLCKAVDTRIKSKAAGGRQAPSDAMSAGARDLLAAINDPNFDYGMGGLR